MVSLTEANEGAINLCKKKTILLHFGEGKLGHMLVSGSTVGMCNTANFGIDLIPSR